ncbi:PilZ domain-containing protein [bacterium]|nr:PilZ domain-containing protein [bacterium]
METSNRRVFRRIIVELKIDYCRPGGKLRSSACRDLSAGGLKLQTPEVLPVSTPVEVILHVPGIQAEEIIHRSGVVVWNQPDAQDEQGRIWGIKFDELLADELADMLK